MRDPIIKQHKDKKVFFFSKSVDPLSSAPNKTPEFVKFRSNLSFINKLLFNFLIFNIIVLGCFLIIILVSIASNVFALKNRIISYGTTGIKNLELAQKSLLSFDLEKSSTYFKNADESFNNAEKEISKAKFLTASLSIIPIVSDYEKSGRILIAVGKTTSEIGIELSEGAKEFSDKNKSSLDKIQIIVKREKNIKERIIKIENFLSKINTNILGKEYSIKIEKIKNLFPEINSYLNISETVFNNLPEISGIGKEKNYLLLFQNNNELRSTGGFIGSFGIIKLKDGEMKDFFIDDVYKLDKKYAEAVNSGLTPYIEPPFPMDPKSTGNWALRDSNLNPNFPESAKTISDFYEKEVRFSEDKKYPEKIDGIITITPTVLEEILSIIGPTTLEEYGLTIDSNNLLETIQIEVEAGQDKQKGKNPKEGILSLLKNKILEKISLLGSEENKKILFSVINKLDEKHILLYFNNQEMEGLIKKLNWAGEIKTSTDQDFLMVINNNFGGGKSSLKISELIEQQIKIDDDGSIIKKVDITREHTSDYYMKYFDPWSKQEMWLIGVNSNYMKIYVPKGSILLESSGTENKIDILEENSKTVFGSNFSLSPKQKKTISISYKLPFKIKKEDIMEYSLYLEKQPGSLNSLVTTKIELPNKTKIESSNLKKENTNTLSLSGDLLLDRFLYLAYSIKK